MGFEPTTFRLRGRYSASAWSGLDGERQIAVGAGSDGRSATGGKYGRGDDHRAFDSESSDGQIRRLPHFVYGVTSCAV